MNEQPVFEDRYYSSQDALRLHVRIYGSEPRDKLLPVVCLPGLTRNARDFHELALFLSQHPTTPRTVVCFDYRGRGLSEHDRDWRNYSVPVEAGDVIAGLAAIDIEHAAFIGTSRGGLIMHVLAAARPGVMKAGILNDVGPVIEGAGLAQIRAYLENAPVPKNWLEATAAQQAVVSESFPALNDGDIERMVRALYSEKDGRLAPDFDPRLLKTITGIDLSRPLPVLWPQFIGLTAMPLMVIRGENSRLLSEETVRQMQDLDPDLVVKVATGQGHAPLLETAGMPQIIAAFLAGVG